MGSITQLLYCSLRPPGCIIGSQNTDLNLQTQTVYGTYTFPTLQLLMTILIEAYTQLFRHPHSTDRHLHMQLACPSWLSSHSTGIHLYAAVMSIVTFIPFYWQTPICNCHVHLGFYLIYAIGRNQYYLAISIFTMT